MQAPTAPIPYSNYKEICQRLSKLTTPLICDALPSVRLMDPGLAPMGKETCCIGLAYTVNSAKDSLSIMQALDDLQAYLAYLNCNETDNVPIILTVAAYGAPYALVGGMCAAVAKVKGFSGIVTDGYCRDIQEIQSIGLPLFARGKCAKSGAKDKVGTLRETIQCGGVAVDSGDIIFADSDGIVVMNKQEATTAMATAEEMYAKENLVLKKINGGARFNEISNIDAHVENIRSGKLSKLTITVDLKS